MTQAASKFAISLLAITLINATATADQNIINPLKDRGIEVNSSSHWFTTPSTNIFCNPPNEERQSITCFIKNGSTIEIATRGEAHILQGEERALAHEPGDSSFLSDPVLQYGTWISAYDIVCLSEKSGLTCQNQTNHGFILSTSNTRVF